MYYIKDSNDKIVLADDNLQRLKDTLLFKPELKEEDIVEVPEGYIIDNFELITTEEKESRDTQKEKERVAMLKMTPLDFLKAINKLGISYDTVKEIMAANPEVEMEMKYCQNVYRGHDMINKFAEQYGITSDQLDKIFKEANGEEVE